MTDPSLERTASGPPTPAAIAGRLLRPFLPLVAAAPILWLTLMPGRVSEVAELPWWCLVCGARGIADGILNIALFVPLGWALAANGWRPRRALAAGLLLSGGIEVAQVFIPNRFPGVGDVLYNAAGAGLGALVRGAGVGWLRPASRRPMRRAWTWGALGLAALLAVPLLLTPAVPSGSWTAEWAPRVDGHDVFRGRMLYAGIAGREIPPGPVSPADSIPYRLREGADVELAFRVGPIPQNLAPIFTLVRPPTGPASGTVEPTRALLIGVDDRDLIVRTRAWADRLLLDRPDFRDPGWRAAWEEGETVALTLNLAGGGVRVRSEEDLPRRLTIPSSRGWSFLLYGKELDRRWGGPLDLAWMALWAIPLGLWAPGLRFAGPASAWAAGLLLLPLVSPSLSPGWAGLAGIALGVAVGRVVGVAAARALRVERAPRRPASGTAAR